MEKELAKKGIISKGVKFISEKENVNPEIIAKNIAEGTAVVLKHKDMYMGIGKDLKTKINTNIGTSPDIVDIGLEVQKLKYAIKYGTDTLMDLSTGGDLDKIRREIIKESSVPIGTVPIYQSAIEVAEEKGGITKMDEDKIFQIIEKHAKDGVSFMTVHCGITLNTLQRL
ncbi:MAG TPA: phosphomethylpyrimidine synthase ThiC, partial [Candidatus Ratteibacteria bacterium]|nr:phosphomethylpyrimidine synthase ThiC [Candidatus Ratteibacteria bacterium]